MSPEAAGGRRSARGEYAYAPIERVVWGEPAAEAAAREVERLGARRVLIVASRTLAQRTPVVDAAINRLGPAFAGLFTGCREHTPLDSVLSCCESIRDAGADLVLTIGGGTPIDTVKIAQLCLAHGVRAIDALAGLAGAPHGRPSPIRQIAAPTTLSGGEHTSFAGGTNAATRSKDLFHGPDLCARAVILDPGLALHTPWTLWASSGIRALDHAVETFCSPEAHPLVEATALRAIELLSASLRRTRADPADLQARQQSLTAAWLAAAGLGRVPMGASHGLGYLLGAQHGVPHGQTSCVLLPAVLRWNAEALEDRQRPVAAALGRPDLSAADAVAALIADLGLPRTLREVGLSAADLETLANQGALHPVVRANPREIRSEADVAAILGSAF